MSLHAILDSAEGFDQGLKVAIPADWHQGRTAYGGLSAALAYAAACRVGGELTPLRSALVSFVGPLAGKVTATARILRSGRNATWMAAEVASESGVGLTASFVFMSPVASEVHVTASPAPAPLVPPEQAVEVPDRNRPVFLHHFDVRFALPPGGERRPEVAWWVRHRERDGLDPVTEVLSIADALPPGVLPLLRKPVNVSSMTWLINLLDPAPRTHDGWWLLRTASEYAEAGCASDDMRLWNTNGVPVILGMQSVAVFG
jgi:acyl-CoA thioesterase